MMGYDKQEHKVQLTGKEIQLTIKLNEAYNQLNAVVITAGSFEASEERKAITLKPAGYCNNSQCCR